MPNWCENDLVVSGNKTDRDKFINGIKDFNNNKQSILDSYYPVPEELVNTLANGSEHPENKKKYGFNNWYDWCISNWGTKWGDCDLIIKSNKTTENISFSSAWSPPVEGFIKISTMFPELTFKLKFFERGMQFKGMVKIKNGDILEQSHGKYNGHRGG